MKKIVTFLMLCLATIVAACDTAVPTPLNPTPSGFPILRGTNLTGGEWAWDPSYTPAEGSNYQFVSHQDIDYLYSKGFRFGRLLFSWEILQPTPTQAFATGYDAALSDRVAYMTGKGMQVMIEPHGGEASRFARYKGAVLGSAGAPNSYFADLWYRLALKHKGNPNVIFGLMNEPNNISTMAWFQAAQAAINAIRSTGATNTIMVPGNGFSQPSSWNDTWYDTASLKFSNATGFATLNDPLKRTVISVHTYFDANAGGGAEDIASPTIIATRMAPVVTYARSKGLKVHLSEFGAKYGVTGADVAVTNALNYINANSDVIIGWSWWAYGPPSWWGNYRFTLCPKNNYTVDDPKIAWLKPYLNPVAPVPAPDAATPVDSGVIDAGVVDSGPVDSGVVDSGPVDAGPVDAGPPPPSLRVTSTKWSSPGDAGYTFSKYVPTGSSVPTATYSMKVAVKTSYSDDSTICVAVIVENPNTGIDVDWSAMTIDLRSHTFQSGWASTVTGTTGTVTVKPDNGTKTVLSKNKNNFGFCMKRSTTASKENLQVIIRSLTW